MIARSSQPDNLEAVRRDIATNLKRLRNKAGIAQETLAYEADVDRTMVSKIERAVANPSISTLLKLANRLNVGMTDLFKKTVDLDESL